MAALLQTRNQRADASRRWDGGSSAPAKMRSSSTMAVARILQLAGPGGAATGRRRRAGESNDGAGDIARTCCNRAPRWNTRSVRGARRSRSTQRFSTATSAATTCKTRRRRHRRQGTLLTIELPASWGLPKLRLHAEKEREFFTTELPLQATFEVDSSGKVTGILVYPPRGQRAIRAQRLDIPQR